MRKHHINRRRAPAPVVACPHGQLREFKHFIFSDMVDRSKRARGVRRGLKVTTTVVSSVVNARNARNAHPADRHHAGAPEVVNVGGDPSAIVEFLQVIGRFVVPADKQCQYRSDRLAAVVPVEGSHGQVLARDVHRLEVLLIAHCLEVPAAYQEVDFLALFLLHPGDGRVDLVQLPVAAAFHDDAQVGVLHFCFREGWACDDGGEGRSTKKELDVCLTSCC